MDSYNELLKERQVTYKPAGVGRVFTDPDADRARSYFRDQKPRKMTEKVTTVQKVGAEMIYDGDYLGVGGFGANRILTAVLHEIVRQKKRIWVWWGIRLRIIFRFWLPVSASTAVILPT